MYFHLSFAIVVCLVGGVVSLPAHHDNALSSGFKGAPALEGLNGDAKRSSSGTDISGKRREGGDTQMHGSDIDTKDKAQEKDDNGDRTQQIEDVLSNLKVQEVIPQFIITDYNGIRLSESAVRAAIEGSTGHRQNNRKPSNHLGHQTGRISKAKR